MEDFQYVDIFATKGIEYLVVIAFLFTLIIFWRFLNKGAKGVSEVNISEKVKTTLIDWFYLADNFFYHQGHSWAVPESSEIVRVGIDDFAQKLLGRPGKIELPKLGENVRQGERGWRFKYNGKSINVLSPVNGKVVAVNQDILKNPALLNENPYTKGWLLKVKPTKFKTDQKNLLSGVLAHAWMENTVNLISQRMTGNLGVVLQDGGLPISGFVKEISPEKWDRIAKEFLLTEEMN
jgi:glycine cleavage system H lipoate-binding protein